MKVVFVIFYLLIWCNFVSAKNVIFHNCGYEGFECTKYPGTNNIIEITFQCPIDVSDTTFHINGLNAPRTTEEVVIKNCDTITIESIGENKAIQKLVVSNVGHLIFERLRNKHMLPPTVILQNVSFIQEIPFGTFAQSEQQGDQPDDFQYIHFENVTIDTIQSNAFFDLNQLKNFSFVNVNIKTIQTSGIKVNLNHIGEFRIFNSSITVIESLGIQVYAKRSVFLGNKLTDVQPNAINGTMEDFYFIENSVKTLHPYAFSVLATNIFIQRNTFLLLKSNALERLSPGMIQPTVNTNFGKLKFLYDFSKNVLNFVEAGGLHPDYTSYENVKNKMTFRKNGFLCSCQNLGWLFSALGHGGYTSQVKSFYEIVLDEFSENFCDRPFTEPCTFLIKKLRNVMTEGLCSNGDNIKDLC